MVVILVLLIVIHLEFVKSLKKTLVYLLVNILSGLSIIVTHIVMNQKIVLMDLLLVMIT